jgi:hypothetical protein
MTGAQGAVDRKALIDAIYRIDPFDGFREGRAIGLVGALFGGSSAPEFMLENLLEELRKEARRQARLRAEADKQCWRDILVFLEKALREFADSQNRRADDL